eukprot:1612984-Alexandrium_andersonii.AAC.1
MTLAARHLRLHSVLGCLAGKDHQPSAVAPFQGLGSGEQLCALKPSRVQQKHHAMCSIVGDMRGAWEALSFLRG